MKQNQKNVKNGSNSRPQGFKPARGKQGRKDSNSTRSNFDNARESKLESDIEEGSKMKGRNDISFWNRNPEFMKAAGCLPFASILGTQYSDKGKTVPGIMSISYVPSIGEGLDNQAFQKCFEAMQSFMIHANSRTYKYDFPDTAMYVIGGSEVFTALETAKRVYGLYRHYSPANEYLARTIVRAAGFDPEDIRKHLSTMWFDINQLILDSRQIWIPNSIPFLERQRTMCQTYYTDAPGERSQMYIFVRRNYWMLDEVASDQGTCLVPATYNTNGTNWSTFYSNTGVSGTGIKWEQFKSMIENMIHRLIASGSRSAIYGDILTAYGASGVYALTEFPSTYEVIPEYNAEVLTQIENITVSRVFPLGVAQHQGTADNNSALALFQYWNFDPVFSKSGDSDAKLALVPPNEQILNFHFAAQPTPEAIMVATRFKVGGFGSYDTWVPKSFVGGAKTMRDPVACATDGTYAPGSFNFVKDIHKSGEAASTIGVAIRPRSVGTEVVTGISIYTFNTSTNDYTINPLSMFWDNGGSTTSKTYLLLMAFDWHPFVYGTSSLAVPKTVQTTPNLAITGLDEASGDYDNYITLEPRELEKLHNVAVYSVFGVAVR